MNVTITPAVRKEPRDKGGVNSRGTRWLGIAIAVGIPALLVFKSGSVVNQIVGAVPKNNITQILDEVI